MIIWALRPRFRCRAAVINLHSSMAGRRQNSDCEKIRGLPPRNELRSLSLENLKPRPSLSIALSLLPKEFWFLIERVHAKRAGDEIVETIGGIKIAGVHVDPDARAGNEIQVDAGTDRVKLGIIAPEALTIPKVDARLVSYFYRDRQIPGGVLYTPDHRIFGVPG